MIRNLCKYVFFALYSIYIKIIEPGRDGLMARARERARESRDPIFMVVFSTNPDLWVCSWPRAEFPSQCFASDRVARAAVEWDGCRRDRISIPVAFLPLSAHFLEHHYTRRTPRIVVNPRKPFVCCYFSFFFRATQNCVVSPLPTLHSTLCVFFLCCRTLSWSRKMFAICIYLSCFYCRACFRSFRMSCRRKAGWMALAVTMCARRDR